MNKLRSVLQGALLLTLSSTLCAQNIHPNQAAIASSHPAATVAGFEVLATDGNAFDTAVAISAALAVAELYGVESNMQLLERYTGLIQQKATHKNGTST